MVEKLADLARPRRSVATGQTADNFAGTSRDGVADAGGTVLLAGARGGATARLKAPPRARPRLHRGPGVHVDMAAERLLPHEGRKMPEGQGLGLVPPEVLLSPLGPAPQPRPSRSALRSPLRRKLDAVLTLKKFCRLSEHVWRGHSELRGYKLMMDTDIHHGNE